ncbi:apoptosis-inducing TAF9-like domain 1 family protein [Zymoseptoria brevis]|uniref:Apoptosis-inducing TAF9-like domain 1 family protein n=1 Tax=Zymoseptoria brevis TaxID=1047168 RepID=A0A0F4GJH7_9PEZI|nr:apoptosis-inducing TAF9-like domain 1 family protein [Zymoseptoria brevis]
MPSLASDDAINDERQKSALWYAVGKIVDEVTLSQGLNASPHFIGGLSELVAAKISAVSTDLEAFAQHDGRTTIGSKDVLLLARNNDALRAALQEEADEMKAKDKRAVR